MWARGQTLRWVLVLCAFIGGISAAKEGDFPATTELTKRRHTLKELRDQHVVKQQLDYSCGAAALATLMEYYYGEETSEQEILELLNTRLKALTPEEVARKRRIGFSLLDLKIVAQQKGYQAAGFQLSIEQLRQLAAPVIVYVRPLDYHHFAVLRGIIGDRVFIADPSRGNLRMSLKRFSSEYGGVIFVLGKPGEEHIINYPLALARPDDYTRPELRRTVHRLERLQTLMSDFAGLTLPR